MTKQTPSGPIVPQIHKFVVLVTEPDDDGDWRVEFQNPNDSGSVEYSTDLGSILPSSNDFHVTPEK